MYISRIRARGFKRFHDLTMEVSGTPRLVMLCGPNGIGKSSLIDALRLWHGGHGSGEGWFIDESYHRKAGEAIIDVGQLVEVEFEQAGMHPGVDPRKVLYARSAYRHEAEFESGGISRTGDLSSAPRSRRMIEVETKVSDNYRRLVAATLEDVYSGAHDRMEVAELRDLHISRVRDAVLQLFPDLELQGPGDPLGGGTFFFRKGGQPQFHYKNLSGGEKAAFDLILDLVVKTAFYDDTIMCIDEPELHLNTRLQADLLDVLLTLTPPNGQLWIATHSIGMMRRAQSLATTDPNAVAFFDFENRDFNVPIVLTPVKPDRDFWTRVLRVALDDLADLVAPDRVVLCEGRPAANINPARAEFDARCYRRIFAAEFPRTDFLSVGNAAEVAQDRVEIGRAIQTLVSGTEVIRVVDRDQRSPQEVASLAAAGLRVLTRRHIESYLLDDEVIGALCESAGRPETTSRAIAARYEATEASVGRGNDVDDFKSAAGDFWTAVRQLLALVGAGNSTEAFLADTMAPLIVPGMAIYDLLRTDIFGT